MPAPSQVAAPNAGRCPVDHARDDRKSASAARGGLLDAPTLTGFDPVRAVLRDPDARQAGFKAEVILRYRGRARPPILFLHGEAHRRQRGGTARFFTPRVVETRYRELMERTSAALIARLVRDGGGDLDRLSLELAVTVAAEIVGLTESDIPGMSRRLDAFFSTTFQTGRGKIAELMSFLLGQWRMRRFYARDVKPAIEARRAAPREDVISHLLSEGYTPLDILTECFTYGAAGMVTTREFITMAGWHLLERPELRAQFLAADADGQIAILEEILRLEPVVGTLYRHTEGGTVALDIRAANGDTAAVGACPHALDPDRTRAPKVTGPGLAFGDGEHRCPGAGVALHESAVFLDRLLRIPGMRLERAPDVGWNPLVAGYELRNCRLVVDPT
ncbi:cytochrome P450 [Sphingomonas sp. J344]|uniref:cytochrome P450 n=1 Tax=Sphingomonas sp. J344 TaxID=2898434 RepID=UPI0021510F09|nr:cytochrome P450 [Sphingomonas sp. J344]MCR5871054.1 cytochrome P450 [Sphingomonas sp. J344]